MKVYLASQIFAECWRDYNEKVASKIRYNFPGLDLYVPQENKSINDKTKCATSIDIATGDLTNNLDNDDVIVAIIDGDVPGAGTNVELGYFARRCQEEIDKFGKTNKRIIALYTDSREASYTWNEAKQEALKEFCETQYSYLNLLTVGVCKKYGTIVRTIDEVVDELRKIAPLYGQEFVMED